MKPLNDNQRRLLAAMWRCIGMQETGYAPGLFPVGAGQHATIRALRERGLVEFIGWGRDIDLEHDDDVPLYGPTYAGIRLAVELRLVTWEEAVPMVEAGLRALTLNHDVYGYAWKNGKRVPEVE